MRKKIILKLKPTVQKNNRHFVIFEFKYHAINMRDNSDIGMYHAYLLRDILFSQQKQPMKSLALLLFSSV